ncbi:hypothetical protein FRC11_011622 [Ceratobasidium sp. 423]|nr:hypothetical protein FRC11_011622 [Ceratobasidium sp. 423]
MPSGVSGGKAAAATVKTNTEYELLLAQLCASKKNAKDITPAPSNTIDCAIGLGTKVPQLANMDAPTQLHGNIITMLKATHPYEKHHGEHGEPGFCYVTPDGAHIGLNNHQFTIWSAAVAAGDATRHIPPNVAEFDGHQGLGPATTKPRGHGSTSAIAPPVTPATPSDPIAMFMAAMVPLLVSLTQSMVPHPTPPPVEERVPHEHLAGVLGVSEGKTIQFQLYCHQWAKEFSCKRKEKEVV